MFGIGWTELVVIFFLALLVFGPKRLPEIGRSLGKALQMFKEATREARRSLADVQSEIEAEMREAERAKTDLQRSLLEDHSKPAEAREGGPQSPSDVYREPENGGTSCDDSSSSKAPAG